MTDKATKKPKQKSAVGIKYNQDSEAGTSSGGAPSGGAPSGGAPSGLADEIITLARQNGVLVHEDPYLSDFLATLDLGQEIPDQLYHVIAELISFSYVLQGKFPDSWAKMHNKVSKKV
jgi:flagellar biosynthesis protein